MQKQRALLFFVASVVWMLVPLMAAAQGLVPCEGLDCDLCKLGQLMQNIINFLIGLSVSVAAAMFAYAGFLYVTGGSNPTQISKAHKIFKSVLIGFLIAISAYLVVQTLLSAVFDQESDFWVGSNWFELKCSAQERLMNRSIDQLISEVIPSEERITQILSVPTPGGGVAFVGCEGPNAVYSPNFNGGMCFDEAKGEWSQPVSAVSGGTTRSDADLAAAIANTKQYQVELARACAKYGLNDCAITNAIMAAESGGRAVECNGAGACGPMQVLPTTACGLNRSMAGCNTCRVKVDNTNGNCSTVAAHITTPSVNIDFGVNYISQLSRQFGENPVAIAAGYNGGPNANRTSRDCPGQTWWQCTKNEGYAETRNYVPNVLKAQSFVNQ